MGRGDFHQTQFAKGPDDRSHVPAEMSGHDPSGTWPCSKRKSQKGVAGLGSGTDRPGRVHEQAQYPIRRPPRCIGPARRHAPASRPRPRIRPRHRSFEKRPRRDPQDAPLAGRGKTRSGLPQSCRQDLSRTRPGERSCLAARLAIMSNMPRRTGGVLQRPDQGTCLHALWGPAACAMTTPARMDFPRARAPAARRESHCGQVCGNLVGQGRKRALNSAMLRYSGMPGQKNARTQGAGRQGSVSARPKNGSRAACDLCGKENGRSWRNRGTRASRNSSSCRAK